MPQFPEITDRFRSFIEQQKIFFVGTAARASKSSGKIIIKLAWMANPPAFSSVEP
jgi:hypothetical protein